MITDRERAQHTLYPIHRTVDISYEELNRDAQRLVDRVAALIGEVREESLTAVETLDRRVLEAWAEAGDDPRGRGYAMGLSIAAAAVGRPVEVWASPERRENVQAEVERLRDQRSAVERIRDLHTPFGIYDECDHGHSEEDLERGDCMEIMEVGLTCDEGLMYRICISCCTDDGGQTEGCVDGHDHGKDEPICPTIAALDAAR